MHEAYTAPQRTLNIPCIPTKIKIMIGNISSYFNISKSVVYEFILFQHSGAAEVRVLTSF